MKLKLLGHDGIYLDEGEYLTLEIGGEAITWTGPQAVKNADLAQHRARIEGDRLLRQQLEEEYKRGYLADLEKRMAKHNERIQQGFALRDKLERAEQAIDGALLELEGPVPDGFSADRAKRALKKYEAGDTE
jgi:hypothetical protein